MTAIVLLVAGTYALLSSGSRSRVVPHVWRIPRPIRRSLRVDQDTVVEVVTALRDALAAGAALRPAFERSVQTADAGGLLAAAATTSRMGGDVPQALRRIDGAGPLLYALAALWQVGEMSGAGLAAALDRLVDAARESTRIRQEVASQLAGPRATMRVLALLPLVGVGMGVLMGANPLAFLFGSVWGWVVVVAAALLEALGVWWMRKLVAGIEALT